MQNKFSIQVSSVSAALQLTSFNVTEKISEPFHCHATFFSTVQNLHQSILKSIAQIQCVIGNSARIFEGAIMQCVESEPDARGNIFYAVHIVPEIVFLLSEKKRLGFQNKTAIEILQMICALKQIRNVECSVEKNPDTVRYEVQWNETDYAFLARVLADAQLYYYFHYEDNLMRWKIADTYKGYLFDAVHLELENLQVTQEAKDPFEIVSAKTHEPSLFPGMQIAYAGKFWNVVSVDHVLTTQYGERVQEYSNQVQLFPEEVIYKPPIQKIPKALGIYPATIAGGSGQKINIDDRGRVQLLFPWQADKMPTPFMDRLEAVSGAEWGTQWIPCVGDAVWVQYLEHDPRFPVVIGMQYTESNLAFALPENQHLSGFCGSSLYGNPGQHQLIFNDDEKAPSVHLQSGAIDYQVGGSHEVTVGDGYSASVQGKLENTVSQTISIDGKKEVHIKTASAQVNLLEEQVLFSSSQCEIR